MKIGDAQLNYIWTIASTTQPQKWKENVPNFNISMKIGDAQLNYIWTMCIKFEWNLLSGITNKLGTNCVDRQVQPNP